MSTRIDPDLARVAGMIGQPARAAMLEALLGGEPLAAGELARRAGIAPGTASDHLARLAANGLISGYAAGRYRYFTLASRDVAAALEALARLSSRAADADGGDRPVRERTSEEHALRFARTCYDHLAGTLGVLLADTLVERGYTTPTVFSLTHAGEVWLGTLGVDVGALRQKRRTLTRPCLDWSERRHHLAGAVGASLVDHMLQRRWIVRIEGTRAVRMTLRGREALYRALGLEIGEAAASASIRPRIP
jgi:DNA-binding transcriptional ArsR family regulator